MCAESKIRFLCFSMLERNVRKCPWMFLIAVTPPFRFWPRRKTERSSLRSINCFMPAWKKLGKSDVVKVKFRDARKRKNVRALRKSGCPSRFSSFWPDSSLSLRNRGDLFVLDAARTWDFHTNTRRGNAQLHFLQVKAKTTVYVNFFLFTALRG